MEGPKKGPRVSAASARSYTRKDGKKTPSVYAGLLRRAVLVITVVVASLVYKAIRPPALKVLGSPNGPQVTAPRVQMRDGRFLAYKEVGVPREQATYKIINVHGYGGSRNLGFPASKELIEELGVYIVSYDRAGYAQSDPNPSRSIKSEVNDVNDLADALELGPTFHVIGTSIGGYTIWGLLKYLPHRLAGVAMLAPVTNYWWPGIPSSDLKAAWDTQKIGDRLSLGVAHYAPWLLYWYMTQPWFPSSSVNLGGHVNFNTMDKEILAKIAKFRMEHRNEATQQSVFESQHRDILIMFSTWDFQPTDLENPFTNSSASVHVWQGDEDYLVPVILQRYVARSLPWVQYHELPGKGHLFQAVPGYADEVLSSMLLGKQTS